MNKFKRFCAVFGAAALTASLTLPFFGCGEQKETVTLRVANWEEYIDLGEWGEDELIDIENAFAENPEDGVFGENSMVDDFTEWFNSTHDYEIEVEYSTFVHFRHKRRPLQQTVAGRRLRPCVPFGLYDNAAFGGRRT